MVEYNCVVEELEDLRLPNLYRVKTKCGAEEIVLEMHRDLMVINKGEKLRIVFTTSKDECLKHEFCGNSYVVSITKLDDKYRITLSIHGPLVILYTSEKPKSPFKVMNKVYIGVSRS